MLAVMLVSEPLYHLNILSTLKGCSKVKCCTRFTSKVYNVYGDIAKLP